MARLFLGIPLSQQIYQELLPIYQMHVGTLGLRWVVPENYHLTVYFMGEVNEVSLGNFQMAFEKGFAAYGPFTLTFESYYLAPKAQEVRMLWARWKKHPQFTRLVQRADYLYTQLAPNYSHRKNPTPHITLGRFKQSKARKDILLPGFPSLSKLEVKELILWQSFRNVEEKVEYREISRIPLLKEGLGSSEYGSENR